jgi:hypothetical protein
MVILAADRREKGGDSNTRDMGERWWPPSIGSILANYNNPEETVVIILMSKMFSAEKQFFLIK